MFDSDDSNASCSSYDSSYLDSSDDSQGTNGSDKMSCEENSCISESSSDEEEAVSLKPSVDKHKSPTKIPKRTESLIKNPKLKYPLSDNATDEEKEADKLKTVKKENGRLASQRSFYDFRSLNKKRSDK